jgi:UDP-GlcNAc3NAcA epimerase
MKIFTIVGARPQFIKAAALSRQLKKYPVLNETIVHTGQHFDENMSAIFFSEMDIPQPHYHLHVNNLSHGAMTGRMLEQLEGLLLREKPDLVLVYGDTNSTIAGALAAKKLHIKLAHVEAGLRSYNMNMPEEINRILTDRISDWLFCPTDQAVENLLKEGFADNKCMVVKTGDVMEDAALYYATMAADKSTILNDTNLVKGQFILATIHREENTNNIPNLLSIIDALNELHNSIMPVIVPLHPRSKNILQKHGIKTHFTTIAPVGYFDMLQLLQHCALVITDSGGLQKEAFFFSKYCITARNETEWTELVASGYNTLCGADTQAITTAATNKINTTYPPRKNLYGNGNASENICSILLKSAE